MEQELTQALVEQWVSLSDRAFTNRIIWQELGINYPEDKSHLKVILNRLKAKGIVQTTGEDGHWRKVDNTLVVMDWQDADPRASLDLTFPFNLEGVCKLYPKSIVIVAGSKQAGKTAFLLNFAVNNMNSAMGLDVFNSETGPEQLKSRLDPMGVPRPCPFKVYERYDSFADVIDPDRISVIDYLDLNSEVYMVGKEIDDIFRKLNKGIAVIGLQKPPGRDLAYGAGFTAKRAQLYISLDSNKMKLVYVKTPRDVKNPDNMMWTFKLDDGIHFTDIDRYYGFDGNGQ